MSIIPPYLKPGDKIVIVSPSGVVDPVYLEGASARLREWDLNPAVGKHALCSYGRFAGTPDERIEDLQQAIDDPETKAILCSRGGYGALQIIDQVDFSSFEVRPKWLIGFSDITVLHAAINSLEVASIHGIMAKHLTESDPDSEPVTRLHDILFGKNEGYEIPPHPLNRTGKAKGILTGGNLSVLYGLRGTHYDLYTEDKILFLEDIAEKPYHIDRMMQNLKIGGILENLSGLLVGQFTDIEEDESMMKTVYEIIADAVSEYDYPVCFDFPAGHIDNNLPLLMGANYELEVDLTTVKLKMCR